MDVNAPKLGKALRGFRTRQQLSLDALAEKLNVSRGTIVNWENGISSPNFETCKTLYAMGMDFIGLLKNVEERTLDQKDANNLAQKISGIIKSELNQRVYGLNLLDQLTDDNRSRLSTVLHEVLQLETQHQDLFFQQILKDAVAFQQLHEKYDIKIKEEA
ncbi:MAG: transcriptional regulator with XRE-family HTH domain [bacterium]|jgi:transcriptional regulator with XRE-family HTH domain